MQTLLARLHGLPRYLLSGIVRTYRLLFSAWLGSSCRFEPTCSVYSLQALERFGAVAGTYLTVCRLARCHPFCTGGQDPVPSRAMGMFPWSGSSDQHTGLHSSSTPTDKTPP